MTKYLNARLSDIENCGLKQLIAELEIICHASSDSIAGETLYAFLVLCVYPNGRSHKRRPISSKSLGAEGLLATALRNLPVDVLSLCEELGGLSGASIELSLGKKLQSFLNASIPKFGPAKKVPPLQLRRDSVAMTRRLNKL